jgi:hypothetical protein
LQSTEDIADKIAVSNGVPQDPVQGSPLDRVRLTDSSQQACVLAQQPGVTQELVVGLTRSPVIGPTPDAELLAGGYIWRRRWLEASGGEYARDFYLREHCQNVEVGRGISEIKTDPPLDRSADGSMRSPVQGRHYLRVPPYLIGPDRKDSTAGR